MSYSICKSSREHWLRTCAKTGARIGWVQAFRKHWRAGAENARGAIMVGELSDRQQAMFQIVALFIPSSERASLEAR
jgi:hypothetical protein